MKTSPPESREEVDKFLKIHFPLKFEPAGGIKDKIKAPTILNMKEATESSDLGEYIPTAYNLYRMFSQYEHYSEVSRKFMVREVEHDLELFMVAIDCVFMLQYFSFQLLNIEREFITRYRNLHHHYLLSYGEGQVVKV
ncbi:MAG: hypothetical protein IPP77_13180 [Bacteroidetes bacterium]|nr:hypothetical protein [Bacteroidota bacterium]